MSNSCTNFFCLILLETDTYMIIVTGAQGKLGNSIVINLNKQGYKDLILVDDFVSNDERTGITYTEQVNQSQFFDWLESKHRFVQIILHVHQENDYVLDTDEFSQNYIKLSKDIWKACIQHALPIVTSVDKNLKSWMKEQLNCPFFWAGVEIDEPNNLSLKFIEMMESRSESGIYAAVSKQNR